MHLDMWYFVSGINSERDGWGTPSLFDCVRHLRGVGISSQCQRGCVPVRREVWSRDALGGFVQRASNVRGENMKQGVNWRKIKAEYIAGQISQRDLAKKYGIGASTLMKRASKEGWTKKRAQVESKILAKVEQKTAEAVADNAALMERAKTGLLRLAVSMIESYPDAQAAEIKRKQGGAILTYRMKDIAAVLSVLEDKTQKGQSADIEDLAPLADLLNE